MSSMKDFELLDKLGSGGFATVHKARRKSDGRVVALKMISCESLDEANQALQEGKILLELDHENIIRHENFFLHQDGSRFGSKMYVVIVMAYCAEGDLFGKLEKAYKWGCHVCVA